MRWTVTSLAPVGLAMLPIALTGQVDVDDLVRRMTLEEKAVMVTGGSAWETASVDRLGIPAVWMSDGPVGLRKSETVTAPSVPATNFPSASAMAATWNVELVERVGAAIGAEALSHDVHLLLAPGVNLKRHPRGGRNFEYYSEDPLLGGRVAAAFVRGVQSRGVGATLKHYAVNNQEHRRMVIDARVGERALRELYLRSFEIAVRESHPQAVMSAYNRVNGEEASASRRLLTDVLRGEWGFDGLVVSDWGAMNDAAASISAGLDLEMPGNPLTPPLVVQAVREGRLPEASLDRAVANVLQLVRRQEAADRGTAPVRLEDHHVLARQVAAEGMVLLANDGILPLDSRRHRRLGVAGRLAFHPRIQGVGSSQVTATRVDTAGREIGRLGSRSGHRIAGWNANGDYSEEGLTVEQRRSFAEFLSGQDVTVLFVGQTAIHDAEAWDRPSTALAPADLQLLAEAQSSGLPFVVVVVAGGAVDLVDSTRGASAVLLGWLGGQAFGSAVAEVLLGERAPSGRLSETLAIAAPDHASDVNFPGGPESVVYGEGLYVGYRFFQSMGRDVAYPFGHGLGYTTFEYAAVEAPDTLDQPAAFGVTVDLRNTGTRPGAETVQLYLRHLDPHLDRPDRELIGFAKVQVEPGATERVLIPVEPDRLAYFDDVLGRWVVEGGDYELLVAASAEDVRIVKPFTLSAGTRPPTVYTLDHLLGDLYRDPRGRVVVDFLAEARGMPRLSESSEHDWDAALMRNLPLRKVTNFSRGQTDLQDLQELLDLINSDLPPEQVRRILEGGSRE